MPRVEVKFTNDDIQQLLIDHVLQKLQVPGTAHYVIFHISGQSRDAVFDGATVSFMLKESKPAYATRSVNDR